MVLKLDTLTVGNMDIPWRPVLKLDSFCLKANRSVHTSPLSGQVLQCFATSTTNWSVCKVPTIYKLRYEVILPIYNVKDGCILLLHQYSWQVTRQVARSLLAGLLVRDCRFPQTFNQQILKMWTFLDVLSWDLAGVYMPVHWAVWLSCYNYNTYSLSQNQTVCPKSRQSDPCWVLCCISGVPKLCVQRFVQ